LRDCFRLPTADAKARIAELVEIGDLQPVSVDGWKQRAFLYPSAKRTSALIVVRCFRRSTH
jgi:uncharacterized protein YcaQ